MVLLSLVHEHVDDEWKGRVLAVQELDAVVHQSRGQGILLSARQQRPPPRFEGQASRALQVPRRIARAAASFASMSPHVSLQRPPTSQARVVSLTTSEPTSSG